MTTPSTDPETLRGTAAEIARGLTEAQRKFLLAASKRPKQWMSIRRHAKLSNSTRVHGLTMPLKLMDHGPAWREGYFLTLLGIAVREYLQGNPHDD